MTARPSLTEYLRLNEKYLSEAEKLLAEGDYSQASEKFWGALVDIVKAVAAKGGIELGTHRDISRFISQLAKENPSWNLTQPFMIASALHTNFYEDHLEPNQVKVGSEIVKDMIAKLKSLL